jgi:hypothetical protein
MLEPKAVIAIYAGHSFNLFPLFYSGPPLVSLDLVSGYIYHWVMVGTSDFLSAPQNIPNEGAVWEPHHMN